VEFAHHVDEILVFLKDVLMPRKLEVHFDDGFEAVRGALWRRLQERGIGGGRAGAREG
jgi:hypothetical protein